MGDDDATIEGGKIVLRPHRRTGWETVLNQSDRHITMQLKVFGLRLPLKRRIPFSQVVRVARFSRESWWSRYGTGGGNWPAFPGPGGGPVIITNPSRLPMPDKGWRYDILLTVRRGKTIKIGTVKSAVLANEVEQECRERLGLPHFF
ncbi:MAG: hypothetical protein FJ012_06960 [Chloroflexi bacterium]|nr:hypothetical protein [Chloroflexota bacterium]